MLYYLLTRSLELGEPTDRSLELGEPTDQELEEFPDRRIHRTESPGLRAQDRRIHETESLGLRVQS